MNDAASKHIAVREDDKIIVVIGLPLTGKSTITEMFVTQFPDYQVFHTDDYIQYGYEQSLYVLMEDIKKCKCEKIIIEGVQGYRLLRKGIQLGSFFPDLVVHVSASVETRLDRERASESVVHTGFDKNLCKVWSDYLIQRAHLNPHSNHKIARIQDITT
jgi:hypothetical protein